MSISIDVFRVTQSIDVFRVTQSNDKNEVTNKLISPYYLFSQAVSPLQRHSIVHFRFAALQEHFTVEQWDFPHPHLMTLISSGGANAVPSGTILG